MPPRRKAPPKPSFEKGRKPAKPLWPPGPISSNCPYQWDKYYRRYGELYAQWEKDLDEWKALYGGGTGSDDEGEAEEVESDDRSAEGHEEFLRTL